MIKRFLLLSVGILISGILRPHPQPPDASVGTGLSFREGSLQSKKTEVQEVIMPLGSNSVLKQLEKENANSNAQLRIAALGDTVVLPFIDDFSKIGPWPNAALWLDSGVFINQTYADGPVSLGIATFDGLDLHGSPYDSSSGLTRICDYLTSKPVYNNFPASDSVYFSFFFQPQGLGDEPDTIYSGNPIGDSLALEFKNASGNWDHIWSMDAKPDTNFVHLYIPITSTDYLYDGFQFRFLGYATPNGNRDHWHVDYVRLGRNRSLNDLIPDVTVMYPQRTLLEDYESMPWPHYKALTNFQAAMTDSITDSIANLGTPAPTSATMTVTIFDESGTQIFTRQNTQNSFPLTKGVFTFPLDTFYYPPNTADSAEFYIKDYFSTGVATIQDNDTARYTQKFYNYYAYDDGTAESAYGIPAAGAKVAYKFESVITDTLVGVQMYFNPTGNLITNRLIQLCYWSSIGFGTGTENLIYKRINMRPQSSDVNGYVLYSFDSTLVVPAGTFYVGFIQNDATQLGLGIDRNRINNSNMFYFVSSVWSQSSVQGSWMMRPVFGRRFAVGTSDMDGLTGKLNVYPNPSGGTVYLDFDRKPNADLRYEVFTMVGQIVDAGKLQQQELNLSFLSDGIYLLRIRDARTNTSIQSKLIISK